MLGIYLATRLWFLHRFPYFVDEAQYAYYTDRAAHSLHDLFISYEIGREPLFIWLGIPLVKLGVAPLMAVRLVSMLSGLLTVAVVGLLGRMLGGTSVGLAARPFPASPGSPQVPDTW